MRFEKREGTSMDEKSMSRKPLIVMTSWPDERRRLTTDEPTAELEPMTTVLGLRRVGEYGSRPR